MATIDINAGMVNAQPLEADMRPEDFGAGQLEAAGKAVQQGLTQIAEARIRVDNRRDLINRTRLKNQYQQTLEDEYQRLQVEGDPTDPDQVTQFQSFASEKAMELLGRHDGSQESVGKLSIVFDDLSAGYTRQYSRDVIAAGRTLMKDDLTASLTDIADRASVVGNVDDAFEDVDDAVMEKADILNAVEEKRFKNTGKQSVTSLVFGRLMAERNFEEAEALLNDERMTEIFADNLKGYRKMREDLLVERFAEGKGRREGEQEIAKYAYWSGMSTEAAREKFGPILAQKAVSGGKQTLAQTISAYEAAMSKANGSPYKATPDEIRKIQGTYIASEAVGNEREIAVTNILNAMGVDPQMVTPELRISVGDVVSGTQKQMGERVGRLRALFPEATDAQLSSAMPHLEQADQGFGDTLKGTMFSKAMDVSARISSGMATENDYATLDLIVSDIYKSTSKIDPTTGLMQRVEPVVPEFIKRAYEVSGRQIPIKMEDEGGQAAAYAGTQGGGLANSSSDTVFNDARRGYLTGPGAALTAAGAGLPFGLGEAVLSMDPENPEIVQARDRLGFTARTLVRVLQNNPRFSEGERNAIAGDVQMLPEIFSNPERFALKLYAVDDGLQRLMDEAAKNLTSGTAKARKQALDDINELQSFRDQFGVPPLVSPQDYEAFNQDNPAGTLFRDKKGTIRQTPGAQ